MLMISPRPSFEQLAASMDVAAHPMFLLSVHAGPAFRFRGLNAAHEAATGLSARAIHGHTPHEVLPPRIADTVLANYRECLERRRRVTYEECLELPGGRRWWQTTLRPVSDGQRIFAILGAAFDVTARKAEVAALRAAVPPPPGDAEGAHGPAGARVAEAARGPLNSIIGMSRVLEGDPATSAAGQDMLALIVRTAASAIASLDTLSEEVGTRLREVRHAPLDIGHLCRDLVALVDPAGALTVAYPEARVRCHGEALHVLLHAAIDDIARLARSRLSVTLRPDPFDAARLRLQVEFDTLPGACPDETRLKALGTCFGVRVDYAAEGALHRIALGLEGRLLPADTAADLPPPGAPPPGAAARPPAAAEISAAIAAGIAADIAADIASGGLAPGGVPHRAAGPPPPS